VDNKVVVLQISHTLTGFWNIPRIVRCGQNETYEVIRAVKNTLNMKELLADALRLEPKTMARLRALVETESPTEDKAAVDSCVTLTERFCLEAAGKIRRHRQKEYGDLLEARFGPASRSTKPIILLGHLDTVWPLGTLRTMPFSVRNGRAWGPGVLDMKAGIAMALTALEILQARKLLKRQAILLLNSDEETGSVVSRHVTEKLAQASDAVFVLEPAQGPKGAYKTARKGVGEFRLRVQGVAAHSGVDFDRGHSAISELARLIGKISEFTELTRGTTVNVGVIGGGTRSNVIAAEAWADVDVRIACKADASRIGKRFRSLQVTDKKCSLAVEGGLNRPPMERTPATVKLFHKAQQLAAEIGIPLEEAATGGGSDGNFTSAIGVPTLDGMGAVGEGAHAANESIVLQHLAPRTALLAAMMADLNEL
jgi:glutamate carboxypeptidase